jgi:hypothetical protein
MSKDQQYQQAAEHFYAAEEPPAAFDDNKRLINDFVQRHTSEHRRIALVTVCVMSHHALHFGNAILTMRW